MAIFKVIVTRDISGFISNEFHITANSKEDAEQQAMRADWSVTEGEFNVTDSFIDEVTCEEVNEDNK